MPELLAAKDPLDADAPLDADTPLDADAPLDADVPLTAHDALKTIIPLVADAPVTDVAAPGDAELFCGAKDPVNGTNVD